MYTALIEDQPEKRSRGKSVFTFPLVFLFILVGVASTRHLLNVNANNDLESMVASNTEPKNGGGAAASDAKPCTEDDCWCCFDQCIKPDNKDCKVVMALDMGSSGTKPKLFAIKENNGGIPYIESVKGPVTKKGKTKIDIFKPNQFCGIWSDKNQYQADKESHCDQDFDKTFQDGNSCNGMDFKTWKKHFETQMGCFLKSKFMDKKIGENIYAIFGGATAGLRNDPEIEKKLPAFEQGKGAIWNILTKLAPGKEVHIRMLSGEEESYYEWLGFNWANLKEFAKKEDAQFKNTFTVGGASAQIAIPTAKPMSTLDNIYYFQIGGHKYWIYANSIMWGGSTRLKTMVNDYAKNSGKYGLPTSPESSDCKVGNYDEKNFYECLTPDDRSKIMDSFFKDNDQLLCSDICTYTNPTPDTLTDTERRLATVISKKCDNKQLYKGLCVMGFHFPIPDEWITKEFVGKDYTAVQKGCSKNPIVDSNNKCISGCMKPGSTGAFQLNFNDMCDKQKKKSKKDNIWWSQNNPTVTLPFYGRFWNKLTRDAKLAEEELEISKGTEISWSAIWAAMWMHGRFQGFPSLAPDAMKESVTEESASEKKIVAESQQAPQSGGSFRRNLAGLKGEYTLGPLTIPAHFGTPEDEQ